jgi:hypothetical protein
MSRILSAALLTLVATGAAAQNRSDDEYTRYELLAPETSSFKIIYDVTAVTPGATFFFNPIRRGSVASDESVIDLMSGQPLEFKDVSGAEARESGLANADLEGRYIRVTLARAVPARGEARIRIIKTYKDPKSYYRDGETIVFDRPLGIKRNAVVLPPKYELTSCNIPSQVIEETDGRIGISFMTVYPAQAPLVVRARPVAGTPSAASRATSQPSAPAPPDAPAAVPLDRVRVAERAFQDREIVYFLHEPDTHSFSLYHDFTESRQGTDRYLNIVRAGSKVSNPSARLLDTGETLETATLKGKAITDARIDIEEPVTPESEVVVVKFPAVRQGQSLRIRIEETYTDPARYALIGWYLTTSSVPATVAQADDGRIRLTFWNARNDSIDVFVKARKR